MTDSRRFQNVERLFHEARRIDVAARSRLLDEQCANNVSLRNEVEELLRAHDGPNDAMEHPALGRDFQLGDVANTDSPSRTASPRRIGSYQVIRPLGEGGMGTVYLVEQEHPRRVAALKLIRLGRGSESLRHRFQLEVEALGRLRHPFIAQVYEAGTHREESTGTDMPYLAMEYIDGLPLMEQVRASNLDTRQRLSLFTLICDAVQHAHQQGVIHRDLKPANILVERAATASETTASSRTADALLLRPKILDFGVARIIDADIRAATLQTNVGQLLGTVGYMSPEQATGDPRDVDVRSDVYALGVILFELLAGKLPIDVEQLSLPDAINAIRSGEAMRLSAVDRRYRGDLETIVARALEKDKSRRYQSASELAEDVRRHLDDQPILARAPSTLYHVRKFARRNRAMVAFSAIIVTVLAAGVVATTWQAVSATRARNQAQQRFNDLRQLARVFIFNLDDRLRHVAGTLDARQVIVRTGLDYLDRLSAEARDDHELLAELAAGYLQLGDVQGDPNTPNIGDTAGALESYRKATLLLERLDGDANAQSATPQLLFHAYMKLADASSMLNRADDGRRWRAQALAQAERRRERAPNDLAAIRDLSHAYQRLATQHRKDGENELALQAMHRAQSLLDQSVSTSSTNAAHRHSVMADVFQIGLFHLEDHRLEQALSSFQKAMAQAQTLVDGDPVNSVYLTDCGSCAERIGDALRALGRTDEALAHYQQAVAMVQRAVDAAPDDMRTLRMLAPKKCRVGEALLELGRENEALASFKGYLRSAETCAGIDRQNAVARRDVAVAHYKLNQTHQALARTPSTPPPEQAQHWREARRSLERSLAQFEAMRDQGLLQASDAGVLDELNAELAAMITDHPASVEGASTPVADHQQ